MVLDCDGNTVLMVNIRPDMTDQTETVMVADGAQCTMSIKNTSSVILQIYFVDYTIYHGDEESIETDPIVIFRDDTSIQGIREFRRIPDCFIAKLGGYTNTTTVYTGNEPSNKAIQWLAEDWQGYSNCEYDSFVERYALAAINFAAPKIDEIENTTASGNSRMLLSGDEGSSSSEELWISTAGQCEWPNVACADGWVEELDLDTNMYVMGTIATEIGLLKMMKWFDIARNEIYGTIPSQITELQSLTYFGVEQNEITGTIASEFGEMPNLEWMVLYSNRLSGTIPSEIGSMNSLRGFALGTS